MAEDSLLNELVERVDHYTLASHLTWALWAIIQANTSEIQVRGIFHSASQVSVAHTPV